MKVILSFDGGGIKGIVSATILEAIGKRVKSTNLSDCVDLLAGTSTGAILAAGLATANPRRSNEPMYDHEKIVKLYHELGPKIFDKTLTEQFQEFIGDLKLLSKEQKEKFAKEQSIHFESYENMKGDLPIGAIMAVLALMSDDNKKKLYGLLATPYHSIDKLNAQLKDIYGDIKMQDLMCDTLLTSYNLNTGKTDYFDSRKTTANAHNRTALVREAVAASSAAPTYFKPATVGGKHKHIDGGISVANPALLAYSTMASEKDLTVVSIGTGHISRAGTYEKIERWGALPWMVEGHLIDTLFSAQSTATDTMMQNILGNKYYRFNVNLPSEFSDMDKLSDKYVNKLEDRALEFCSGSDFKRLCDSLVPVLEQRRREKTVKRAA